MLEKNLPQRISSALDEARDGILTLEILKSLRLADEDTLKTTLSRMGSRGRLLRLKRGIYCSNPPRDIYACAQALFGGYLAFSTALRLHGLISELPFTIYVATRAKSAEKKVGNYNVRAVCLREKAAGAIRKDAYILSSRAKTLFDCLYLPECGVEGGKLIEAYAQAEMSREEWAEFDKYAKRFAKPKMAGRMKAVKKQILGMM